MKITIKSAALQPKKPGEEDGMPTYRVTANVNFIQRGDGSYSESDGVGTVYDLSVEVDGRDLEAEHVSGMKLPHELVNEVFWELCDGENPVCEAWRQLHNEQPA